MAVLRFALLFKYLPCLCFLAVLECTLFSPRPAELPRSGVYLDQLGFDQLTASSSVDFSGNYGVYLTDSAWYRQQSTGVYVERTAFVNYLNGLSVRYRDLTVLWNPLPTHSTLSAGSSELVDVSYMVKGVPVTQSVQDSIQFSGSVKVMFFKDSSGVIRIGQFDDAYYGTQSDSLSFFNPGRG